MSRGIAMPRMLYGTAWKKEKTTDYVIQAIRAGFRGVDTACQPRHYREDLVGEALEKLEKEGFKRDSLFVQTKFTPITGQDPNNIPYDPKSPLKEQVLQSFKKSLLNLRTDYIDALLLHSPLEDFTDTLTVWRIFEEFHDKGQVLQLGISNIYDHKELRKLFEAAKVKPSIVQNRFYKKTGYDQDIREFCLSKDIQYQSFWTLTANPNIVNSNFVAQLANEKKKTPEQIFYRYIMKLGIVPLSGTTDQKHMKQDVEVANREFDLSHEEVLKIHNLLNEE